MHFQYLVTMDRDWATSSESAREAVAMYLDEEGFTASGRWAGGVCDWFVIGGHYSGALSRQSWARELWAEIARWEKARGISLWARQNAGEAATPLQAEAQALWDANAPAEYVAISIIRDRFCFNGYPDDAMLLTRELYERLLRTYEGEDEGDAYADLDDDRVSSSMVGNKWIVVVDCHV